MQSCDVPTAEHLAGTLGFQESPECRGEGILFMLRETQHKAKPSREALLRRIISTPFFLACSGQGYEGYSGDPGHMDPGPVVRILNSTVPSLAPV